MKMLLFNFLHHSVTEVWTFYEEFLSNPVPDSYYFEDLVTKFHITVNASSEELVESRHRVILLPKPCFGGLSGRSLAVTWYDLG
jgi:hypothetical protein